MSEKQIKTCVDCKHINSYTKPYDEFFGLDIKYPYCDNLQRKLPTPDITEKTPACELFEEKQRKNGNGCT